MKRKVWMMKHRDSDDGHDDPYCALFGSKFEAEREIQKYVMERWAEGDQVLPDDPSIAVTHYFVEHEDTEWYEITHQDVEFPETEATEDEVDFSQEEVDITYHALGTASFVGLAQRTGLDRKSVQAYVRDIRKKLAPLED